MHAIVAEILAHGAAGKRCQILHRRGIGRGRRHHDRIVERAVLLQHLGELHDGGALLPDRDIDAVELYLLVTSGVERLLVQDGVERDRGLAGLAIADDQLALAAADRDHRIDRLQAGLHGLRHALSPHHARGDLFDDIAFLGVDGTLAVDRLPQRIDDASDQLGPYRDVQDPSRALDDVAFGNVLVVAEDHRTHRVALEIEREPEGVIREFEHLALHRVRQPMHACDAVGQ